MEIPMRLVPVSVFLATSTLGCAVDAAQESAPTELTVVDGAYVGVLDAKDLEWLELGEPETVLLFEDLDRSDYTNLGIIEPDGFRAPLNAWLDVVGLGIPASTFPGAIWAVGAEPERVERAVLVAAHERGGDGVQGVWSPSRLSYVSFPVLWPENRDGDAVVRGYIDRREGVRPPARMFGAA
jgi:hypothetical protein